MEAAKASVKKFISKDGKHDTSVQETVAPAVQQETVTAKQHETQTAAVDREVHQDHYHTSVQPVQDSEVLPEQHHHRMGEVEHRSYEHDDPSQVKERLAAEQAKYRSSSTRVEGDRTAEEAPTVAGEHVHHHVHENIQPVVQKQTIEPHVVHTTKPIHEVHHNAAQHHTSSALPAVSMDEFKRNGGSLTGREERQDRFDGCPPEQFSARGTSGMAAGGAAGGAVAGSGRRRSSSVSSSDEEKRNARTANGGKKPSMMDKLNPKVDADGDGKPGMMN